VREAQFRRLFHVPSMQEALRRRPSRTLDALLEGLRPTQTRLEDRLLAICDRHDVPRPRTQQHLDGHRVDFHWPAQRVVVESDGWEAHGTRAAFHADRAATNALQLAGPIVLRFIYADLAHRPREVADQIRTALGRA
jgi:very-short-patch-repair endonuclease